MTSRPTPTSAHWDLDSYERLARDVASLRGSTPEPDTALRAFAESVLYREARLLDDGDLESWLSLMTGDSLYWIPSNPTGGDPMNEVSLAFDDHRRLIDRVYWLRTGLVSAQLPPSRTRRLISNVEAWTGPDDTTVYVRSNFLLHEFRAGRQRILSGWYGHVLTLAPNPTVDSTLIRTKVIFLTDSDHGHDNLTVVF